MKKNNQPAKFPKQANTNALRNQFTAATREAQAKLATAPHSYVFLFSNAEKGGCIKGVTLDEFSQLVAANGGYNGVVRLADFHAAN